MPQIPISVGELLDKLSILTIKSFKILDKEKARKVRHELHIISAISVPYMGDPIAEDLYTDLLAVNISLWDIEDQLRKFEKEELFNQEFIEFARLVYKTNDIRFELKNKINQIFESDIQEVKQYTEYDHRSEKG
jgi:hypothetical protein